LLISPTQQHSCHPPRPLPTQFSQGPTQVQGEATSQRILARLASQDVMQS
jgi:hypothetical protein